MSLMKKHLKTAILFVLITIMLFSSFSCKEKDNRVTVDKTLADILMEEAQVITDFIRDEGFIYGDARINPAFNWEFLDKDKAINPSEKIVSCDRLVDWILYRAGFTDQVYNQGMTVWTLGPWCEDHNFEKIENPEELQAGDVVFVNPDANYRPAHVFMCASTIDENGRYLRYDAGSNERLQCKKGTEAVAGQQPFLEPIGNFMYAYRPNDSTLDKNYKDGTGSVSSSAVDISIEIKKGTPTIDGKIEKDEYKSHYTMDKSNCNAWEGIVGSNKTEIYFAWDSQGLYYAAEIFDSTPDYEVTTKPWVGSDCLQLALNPGKLIDKSEGIFFTFGATRYDEVVAYRHNYDEKLVSDMVTGKASGHERGNESYIIEVLIPWDLIKLDVKGGNKINTTSFEPKNGAEIALLPCVINCKDGGATLEAAYKFKGTSFTVSQFVPGKLVD